MRMSLCLAASPTESAKMAPLCQFVLHLRSARKDDYRVPRPEQTFDHGPARLTRAQEPDLLRVWCHYACQGGSRFTPHI